MTTGARGGRFRCIKRVGTALQECVQSLCFPFYTMMKRKSWSTCPYRNHSKAMTTLPLTSMNSVFFLGIRTRFVRRSTGSVSRAPHNHHICASHGGQSCCCRHGSHTRHVHEHLLNSGVLAPGKGLHLGHNQLRLGFLFRHIPLTITAICRIFRER